MIISGIYRIVCVKNGRYYYGSSKNVHYRWKSHLYKLRKGKHYNPTLQRVWNKHGETSFRFELTEIVSQEKLFETEQQYLNKHFGLSNCMNVSKDADTPVRNPSLEIRKKISDANIRRFSDPLEREKQKNRITGKKHTLESRARMSEVKKGEKNNFFGKKHSPETIEKMREAAKKEK